MKKPTHSSSRPTAVDLFCGVGGLTKGLVRAGITVKAGIDVDPTCQYAYEQNNDAKFVHEDVTKVSGHDLVLKYWSGTDSGNLKILVGCAPCQPFSTHANKLKNKTEDKKWNLLSEFARIIAEADPDIVSMENVPNLANQTIFAEFVESLRLNKYYVTFSKVYCPDYGIPQKRRRLVLLASKFGKIELIPKTHKPENYETVKKAIGNLPKVAAGEVCPTDPLHWTTNLTDLNLKRIRASKPKGTWEDWDESLRLACHNRASGASYKAVYGRMAWDEPSPTITTQFYNYGTGRFGHPEQDRPLTVREASLLQTFPSDYDFYQDISEVTLNRLGVHIGNAVPVKLGEVIGESILKHIQQL